MSTNVDIVNGRATLRLLRRDINQICSTGKKLADDPSFLPSFRAMFSTLNSVKQNYMSIFESCQKIAIAEGTDKVFPNEEDLKLRNEVNMLYYACIEYHQRSSSNENDNTTSTSSLNKSSARNILPKISIPKFSGLLADWPQFKQLFSSLVHTNPDVSTAEKFYYLRTSLLGDPLSLITPLSLDEINYSKAWDALLSRYDNRRLLATSYVENVLDYSPNQGSPTPSSLQSFEKVVAENVSALQSMKLKDEADFLWLTLALRKLDPTTRRQFETEYVSAEWPKFTQLVEFVRDRYRVLQLSGDVITDSINNSSAKPASSFKFSNRSRVLTTMDQPNFSSASKFRTCHCTRSHNLYQCPSFRDKSPSRRKSFLQGKQICFNCLQFGHLVSVCPSGSRCRTCQGKHHTLLHEAMRSPYPSTQQASVLSAGTSQQKLPAAVRADLNPHNVLVSSVKDESEVILGTAEVFILNSEGTPTPVRLVMDSGSQLSLITSSCAKRLGLHWNATKRAPLGACLNPFQVKGKLSCIIQSRIFPDMKLNVNPLVANSITLDLPTTPLPPELGAQFDTKSLADPMFWRPRSIDILIGGELFLRTITGAPIMLKNNFGALPTIFGIVMMGDPGVQIGSSSQCLCMVESPTHSLARFWETEEVLEEDSLSSTDPCEEHFIQTHYRDNTGRYVVSLPFKHLVEGFAESRSIAIRRFLGLEAKFSKNSYLKEQYFKYMSEYQSLGHMTLTDSPSAYVIPHHAVFRDGPVPKIRVVFDASCSTSSGSLNDQLHCGRKLQRDLCDIILNFRRYAIAISADLVKMYRQVLVVPEHRKFQHIVWREHPQNPIKHFELNTLTQGTASAAFLAIRVLLQLATDEGARYPEAARVLREEMYVDNVVSGASNLEEALNLMHQLRELLHKGNFPIHEWASNSKDFLDHVKAAENQYPLTLSPNDPCTTKVLGLSWDPSRDEFFFQVGSITSKVTKRNMLSVISRLYDPLGFLGPVIFKAKCFMQLLWRSHVDWDEPPEPLITQEWISFARQLPILKNIRIPRYVFVNTPKQCQIIGFCDASQKGFSAVLYLRTVSADGLVKMFLLKGKTKLAPLKIITIPRLELSGAHLLAKLFKSIRSFVQATCIEDYHFFTDSSIVLCWLRYSPHMLQTFVGNRISYITTHTKTTQWHHVPSASNPADISSRGLMPDELQSSELWWNGPEFLFHNPLELSNSINPIADVPELRKGVTLLIESRQTFLVSWMECHSDFTHMIHSLGYVLRFLSNLRSSKADRMTGPLTVQEIMKSTDTCILSVQKHYYQQEVDWQVGQATSKRLLILAAYIDANGILRVGGRLQNSNLSPETKSPIILPGESHFIKIMIDHLHHTYFHLGAQAIQAFIRRKYWVSRLRQTIRSRLRKCLTCFRLKAKPENPIMGNLPSDRVQPSHPFAKVGVDFAGPFPIKQGTRRNSPIGKAYLCVYVCMASKAVHLETVSDMSTDAFLAALDRFISRRGLPSIIRSDCGTNFVGAQRRLKDLIRWWQKGETQDAVHRHASDRQIKWVFNPPYSPHFGGTWEAAVKLAKHHLYKVIGQRPMTFEELTTLFTKIEAIMNSRPIGPLNDDPCHGDFLTPGHLLIGRPLLASPSNQLTLIPCNRLSRWQLINYSVQHFWKRWHAEYLHTLQKRPIWYKSSNPLKIGDLVLLADPGSSPLYWKTALIIECHPGIDGVTRVVTLKHGNSTFKRAVHKLVSLSHIIDGT